MLPTRPLSAAPAWADITDVRGGEVLERPAGALTRAERARLAELVGQLRVVHDLGLAVADRYATFPAEFAATPAREVTLVRALLDRYRVPGPGPGAGPAIRRADGHERAAAIRALIDALVRVRRLLEDPPSARRAPDLHDAYRQLLAATLHQLSDVLAWSPR